MYIDTIMTMTASVILALMRTSSRKAGSGAIIAMTIASTASGTIDFGDRKFRGRGSWLRLLLWNERRVFSHRHGLGGRLGCWGCNRCRAHEWLQG